VESADTPSPVAHGNHSLVLQIPTAEFYAVQSKVQPPQTWHSLHNKQQWITNVHSLLAKSLKKSEHSRGVLTMSWSLTLSVQSNSREDTRALADALITDEEVIWASSFKHFSFQLNEDKAKDLRAMLNTRMRGLIAVDSLLASLVDQSEGSSTQGQ
jgi:hypothetical protein